MDDHTEAEPLKGCPFCGAGETQVVEKGRVWLGMKYGEPSSVSVQHWCEPVQGQPSRMIERVGRDRASAVNAWNARAIQASAQADLFVVGPTAYLYSDSDTPEDAHPWLHSTMLVLAADRRPQLRGETPLFTPAQVEAMIAAHLRAPAVVSQQLPTEAAGTAPQHQGGGK